MTNKSNHQPTFELVYYRLIDKINIDFINMSY